MFLLPFIGSKPTSSWRRPRKEPYLNESSCWALVCGHVWTSLIPSTNSKTQMLPCLYVYCQSFCSLAKGIISTLTIKMKLEQKPLAPVNQKGTKCESMPSSTSHPGELQSTYKDHQPYSFKSSLSLFISKIHHWGGMLALRLKKSF